MSAHAHRPSRNHVTVQPLWTDDTADGGNVSYVPSEFVLINQNDLTDRFVALRVCMNICLCTGCMVLMHVSLLHRLFNLLMLHRFCPLCSTNLIVILIIWS